MNRIPIRLEDGQIGEAAISHFTIKTVEQGITSFREPHNWVPPGDYVRLHIGGQLVMSDTPMEWRTNLPIIYAARDHVLINGLGIGMVPTAILRKPQVEKVTIVEKSADVIALVGPSLNDPRVSIIHADALDYQPPKGVRYGAVWHDIWPSISGDNYPDMKRLHRKYARLADWQGSWCRDKCRQDYREWR